MPVVEPAPPSAPMARPLSVPVIAGAAPAPKVLFPLSLSLSRCLIRYLMGL
jgi:hypothetical protein